MRRRLTKKPVIKPDLRYNSERVSKFVNYLMLDGKKTTALSAVYTAFEKIKTEMKVENPIEVFDTALKNAAPVMEVRSRRVGGANYQVPREVRPERRTYLSMTWIIEAARAQKGKKIADALAAEIIAASKNEGSTVLKRENVHKMAEANKAFAHFAW
jgi:small subunit ribosomal protein S7